MRPKKSPGSQRPICGRWFENNNVYPRRLQQNLHSPINKFWIIVSRNVIFVAVLKVLCRRKTHVFLVKTFFFFVKLFSTSELSFSSEFSLRQNFLLHQNFLFCQTFFFYTRTFFFIRIFFFVGIPSFIYNPTPSPDFWCFEGGGGVYRFSFQNRRLRRDLKI